MTDNVWDRQYISQNAPDALGLTLHKAGVPVDADGDVLVVMRNEADPGTEVVSRNATHMALGVYETILNPAESGTPGDYTVDWFYTLDGVDREYRTYVQVGQADPAYDQLSNSMKDIVDAVSIRFADLFDSPLGGPNLQTYFQTNYNRGRIAQLLRVAMGLLNTTAQPYQTYKIDTVGESNFPVAQWGPLLESALYVEIIKHLVRSYVEQPMFMGSGAVSRLDRRDYMDRWRIVLQDEQATLQKQLEVFKISNMGLGRGKVLASGGVYGRYGPTRIAGSVAARPRYWSRWY